MSVTPWDAGLVCMGLAASIAAARSTMRLHSPVHLIGASTLLLSGGLALALAPDSSPLRTFAPWAVAAALPWIALTLRPRSR